MSESESVKENSGEKQTAAANKKPSGVKRTLGIIGTAVLLIVLVVLVVNALLALFMPHYYPTFGRYRLFAIVSDSMEPEIPTGHMIVSEVPKGEDSIKVGDVITYELTDAKGNITLITHRVVEIRTNAATGGRMYATRGDNAPGTDSVLPEFSDVVGVYTGSHCAFFGSFFAFLQSELGAMTLFFIIFIVIIAWTVISVYNRVEHRRRLEMAALKKSADELSTVNLRYDNIREITAVMDVLGMVTRESKSRAEVRDTEVRLTEFINAESIELPRTAETAAVLDSLPAPDTPLTLAAALRSGATLRQAEDGQTLVLTGMSGGKSILLTPVQTPDGIILCQQGVRIRSAIAPNVEDMGAMSMPEYPEFFEGKPLVHNVEYPELPQPNAKFGPVALSPHGSLVPDDDAPVSVPVEALALPKAAQRNAHMIAEGDKPAQLPQAQARGANLPAGRDDTSARDAYAKYRETAAQLELKQVEQLSMLLDETVPLTPEEKERIAEYRSARKKPSAKPKKQLTPEQRAARKAAAERRKAEQEAFIASLTPADRELYLTEQKLSRARNATIRRLKRINADRKLLEKMDK